MKNPTGYLFRRLLRVLATFVAVSFLLGVGQVAFAQKDCSATTDCAACGRQGGGACSTGTGKGCSGTCHNGTCVAECCTNCPGVGICCVQVSCIPGQSPSALRSWPSFSPSTAAREIPVFIQLAGSVGQTFEIKVQIPPGMPVQVADVRIGSTDVLHLSGIDFQIKNTGSKPIGAWAIWWDIYTEGSHQSSFRWTTKMDSWLVQIPLRPGDIMNYAEKPSYWGVRPITRVVGRFAYTEFTDGTRMGPGADTLASSFSSMRHDEMAEYAELENIYRTRGLQPLISTLELPNLQEGAGATVARDYLESVLRSKGEQALLTELQRNPNAP